ncbi:MAG: hypothetical protein AABY43_06205 [Candidatus Omnitrophota bacterium]
MLIKSARINDDKEWGLFNKEIELLNQEVVVRNSNEILTWPVKSIEPNDFAYYLSNIEQASEIFKITPQKDTTELIASKVVKMLLLLELTNLRTAAVNYYNAIEIIRELKLLAGSEAKSFEE